MSRPVSFKINGERVSGIAAELHFMNWCLSVDQEGTPWVPRSGLSASRGFHLGVYGTDEIHLELVERSGVEVVWGEHHAVA